MSKKTKIGGCTKRLRKKKVSKGQRRSIAKPHGRPPTSLGANNVKA